MTTKEGPRLLTAEMLEAHDACGEQVEIFRAEWPDGVRPTAKAIRRALALGLDVNWCRRLLTASAWAESAKIVVPAWAKYEKIKAPAWAEYEKITAPAWAEYEKITAPAWAAALRDTLDAGGAE